MKTYKAALLKFWDEDGTEFTAEAMDLVNTEDETDRIPANSDDFVEGEIVQENQFTFKRCSYVDDQSFGVMDFAFKKRS